MLYEELKKTRYDLSIIAGTLNQDDNFNALLKDIALNKQWKVAVELGLQPAYLSVIITTLKAVKGL